MLNNPKDEKEALLRLLRARGAEQTAELRPYAADALVCLERTKEALRSLPDEGQVGSAAVAAADARVQVVREAAVRGQVRRRSNRACLLLCEHDEAGALCEWEACAKLDPSCAAVAYNTALLLWKVGERRRACEHWLCFQRWPLHMEASDYERRCAEVLPKPADRGVDSHVCGDLSNGARAALDRMVLSHWARLRHQEAFEQHWNVNPNGATGQGM